MKHRAILIDVNNCQIRQLTFSGFGLSSILEQFIGSMPEIAQQVYLKSNHCLFMDEGIQLLRPPSNGFVIFPPPYRPSQFLGNGLIVGIDDEGETIDATLTVDEVYRWVAFMIDPHLTPDEI